jgi:cell division protein FtsN
MRFREILRAAAGPVAAFSILAFVFAAGPAHAEVKDGVEAWGRGDYDTAVAQWQGPAAKGDADAMFNMGQAYKLGRGVPRDLDKAEDYFRRAAQKGHLRAGDNYGILLFQTNRQAEAMPWLNAAADRGEPRAMYILGIAAYNGDYTAKDPVRAYALMTRAAATGLQQAQTSLAAMNDGMPLEQRQQGVALAQELDRRAAANRERDMTANDLGTGPTVAATPAPTGPAIRAARVADAATAGADYAQPVKLPPRPAAQPRLAVPVASATPRQSAAPSAAPSSAPARPARPAEPHDAGGDWRVQLGAFSQKAHADATWAKIRSRPEIAGHARIDVPGAINRLLAGGYSEAGAKAACGTLQAAGISCLVVNR